MNWLFSGLKLPKLPSSLSRILKINRRLVIISATLTTIIIIALTTMFTSNDAVEAGWYNDHWAYRKQIPVSYTGTETLTEYQVMIDGLDTATMVTDGKLQSDCDDLRFLAENGELLSYSIAGATCNTADTEIWVKTNIIDASDINIYMYYGNPNAASYQSETDTFSYAEEKVVGYLATSHLSNIDIISLEGENSITHNSVTKTLGEYETDSFTSLSTFGDFTAKKPFHASDTAFDTLVPVSWAGTEFIYKMRSTASYIEDVFIVAPWANATVNIYDDGGACGTNPRNITAGNGINVTDCSATSGNDVIRITSDVPVIVNKSESGGDDPYPMHPATTDPWFGFDSNTANVGAGPNGADYRWIDSNDASATNPADLGANAGATIAASGGAYYSNEALKVWSEDYVIGADSTGDSDGGDGTTYMPRYEFGSKFGSANITDFVAVVSDQAATCSTYDVTTNTLQNTATLESSNTEVYSLPASSFGTGNSSNYINDAWYMECDAPVMAISQVTADEQNMWSYPQMRQFTYPTPSVGSLATEEVAPGPIAYWKMDEGQDNTCTGGANDVCDYSSAGNDGAITGATWVAEDQCIDGTCLSFDGTDDYVDFGNPVESQFTTEMTVSTWVRFSTSQNNRKFVSKWGADEAYVLGIPNATANALSFTIRVSNTNYTAVSTNSDYDDGNWHHVVGVYDGANVKLYIDGGYESITGDATVGPIDNPGSGIDLTLGAYSDASGDFTGFIDEVKLYPYARSADEVKSDYLQGASSHGSNAVLGRADISYLSDGLVGYWPMDEVAADTCTGGSNDSCDGSGNGKDGAWQGNATNAEGRFGAGVTLDGTGDYVNIPSVGGNSGSEMTITGWFKADNFTADGVPFGYGSVNDWINLRINTSGDPLIWDDIDNNNVSLTSTDSLSVDTWYHGAIVIHSDGVKKLFIDGAEKVVGTTTTTLPTDIGTDTLTVGRRNYGTTPYDFAGDTDDVRLYNRSLSAAEIKSLYNWAPGPVAHYRFDDYVKGDAQTVLDSSINGYNGTTEWGTNATGMDCTVQGRYGTACEFDDTDDYVNVGDIAELNDVSHFSIGMWVSQNDVSGGRDRLFDKSSDASIEDISIAPWFGSFFVEVGTTGNTYGSWGGYSSEISDGEWYHAAVVFDGTQATNAERLRLFINGVEKSMSYTGTIPSTTYDLSGVDSTIGERLVEATATNNHDGKIDDVQVYNYPLTVKQIINIMNARTVSAEAIGSPAGSPILHLTYDEGYGTTAYDSGSLGDDGELVDGASYINDGRIKKGVTLDGLNDKVQSFTSDNFEFTADWAGLTFSTWVNYSSTDTNGGGLFTKPWNGGGKYNYRLDINSNDTMQLSMLNGDTDTTTYFTSTTATLPNDQWVHLVLTVDTATKKIILYMDQEVIMDTAYTWDSLTAAAPADVSLGIGCLYPYASPWAGNSSYCIEGSIDETKVYNYALSASEVALDYNNSKGIVVGSYSTESDGVTPSNSADRMYCVPGDTSTCRAPVLEYKFDENVEGDAKTLYDTSEGVIDLVTDDGANNTGIDCTFQGKFGTACLFDGVDDFARNATPVDLPDALTISAWVYPTSAGGSYIINSRDQCATSYRGWSQYMVSFSTGLSYRVEMTGSCATGSGGDRYSMTGLTMDYDRWYFVQVTVDDNSSESRVVKFYVDGVEYGTSQTLNYSTSTSFSGRTYTTVVGSPSDPAIYTGSSSFSPFDEVRVYDYVRSDAQRAWDMNQGGPIAHYKFDECSGTTITDWAESGDGFRGNDGTLTIGGSGTNASPGSCSSGTGSEAWNNGTTGKINAAMDFDGTDDYITTTLGTISPDSTGGVSYAAWVKTSTSKSWNTIMAKGNVTSGNSALKVLGLVLRNTRASFIISNGDSTGWCNQSTTGPIVPADGEWHHVVSTFDKTSETVTSYVDGVNRFSASCDQTGDSEGAFTFFVGWDSTSYAPALFDGLIDDAQVFNYALTDAQVKTVYNNGAVRFD